MKRKKEKEKEIEKKKEKKKRESNMNKIYACGFHSVSWLQIFVVK